MWTAVSCVSEMDLSCVAYPPGAQKPAAVVAAAVAAISASYLPKELHPRPHQVLRRLPQAGEGPETFPEERCW